MRVLVCRGVQLQPRGPAGTSLAVGLWPGGVPWQKQGFQVTQRRVNVMSYNTVNVPCFLGQLGQLPRHHLMLLGIGFRWINTSSCGSGALSPDTKATLEVATKNRGSTGASEPCGQSGQYGCLRIASDKAMVVNHVSSGFFQGELGVHVFPEALENSQVSICL